MTRNQLEYRFRCLIHDQRYDEVTPLLRDYTAGATQACARPCDEPEFQAARSFLRSMLDLVKAQRAHDSLRLDNLRDRQRYLSAGQTREPKIDMLG